MSESLDGNIERPVLSIIIPLLDEEENIAALLSALERELRLLQLSYEVIFINDGSRDRTWALIQEKNRVNRNVKGLSLSRNFGPQSAMFAGLHFARGDAIVTMDGDLQHPPERISDLCAAWKQGYKVVETLRQDSGDFSLFKRLTSRWFNRAFSAMSGFPIRYGISDFRLLDRRVVDAIKAMRDPDIFIRGLVFWVGFPATTITYRAADRYSGKTKWTWPKLIKYSIRSLLSFSLVPLRMGIWLGFITSLLAFMELVYIFIRYSQGATVPGWASTLTIISFMFGILFIMIGILGAYLGKIFESVKNRPRFLIDETCGFYEYPHRDGPTT